jgi:FkbM family methyltransferase
MPVFLPSLKNNGHLDRIHMTVCNVGSRKVREDDDYASSGWNIFAPNLTIYGFDADEDACNEANIDIEIRQVNWKEKHIPLALSNSVAEVPLYVTKYLECTSLYPPNKSYLSRFAGISELTELDFIIGIETTTLDTFCQTEGINEIDFLQIDVQGADLNVLEGASWILDRSILAVQIEVEFVQNRQYLRRAVDRYFGEMQSIFAISSVKISIYP